MTEKEKKAIYSFNEWIEISEKGRLDYFQIIDKDIEDMKTVLNLIQNLQEENKKKEKMIDLMAEKFEDLKLAYFKKEDGGEFMGKYRTYNKNDWKQYFDNPDLLEKGEEDE